MFNFRCVSEQSVAAEQLLAAVHLLLPVDGVGVGAVWVAVGGAPVLPRLHRFTQTVDNAACQCVQHCQNCTSVC